jgi:thioredoxin 1
VPTNVLTAAQLQAAIGRATRPVIVDFWAEWCGPCKTMEPVLNQLESYKLAEVVKVNVDASDLGAAYGVQSIPTMLIFDAGAHVDTVVGACSLQSLAARLPARS